ncbi:MAG: hypothetical protein P4L73_13390 [Caulobacteraceae bacterium]|nr:hypothetical protein [Caulobacteraceae bacterium]
MADDNQALLLQISADVNQLGKRMDQAEKKMSSSLDRMEKRASTFEKNVSSAFGKGNVGEALDKVFDSSRLAVLEEGSTRLRVFGSALEPLGPAGIAAAAGVAAMGFAVERAMKVAEWAEGIQASARAIGVTTSALQEFDFVATATGVPIDKMRESLKGITEVIGRVQSGLARGQTVKVFQAIFGGDPKQATAELRSLGGQLDAILPKIVDYAAKLQPTQRAGLASALKIDPTVLNSLIDARGNLSELVDEAHRYGIIVDQDLIKKSADAAEKLHVAAAIIDGEMRVSLADLATPTATAAMKFADLSKSIADVIRNSEDALEPIARLMKELSGPGQKDNVIGPLLPDGAGAELNKWKGRAAFGVPGLIYGLGADFLAPKGRSDKLHDAITNMLNGGHVSPPEDWNAPAPPLLPPVPGASHSTAHADANAVGAAEKGYIEAEIKAAKDLETLHALRLQLINQEFTNQVASARTDKSLSPQARATVLATAALTRDQATAAENQAYQKAIADHARTVGDLTAKYQDAQLAAQADITNSLADRQALERRQLEEQQTQERADLAQKLADDKAFQTGAGKAQATQLLIDQAQAQLAETAAQRARQAIETKNREDDNAIQVLKYQDERLKAELDMAMTVKERALLSAQILKNEQEIAQLELNKKNRTDRASPKQAAASQSALNATNTAQTAQNQEQNQGPLGQWVTETRKAVGDVGTALESEAVKGINDFNAGISQAIVNGKSMGDVFHSILKQMEADLIQYLLKQAEIGIFGGGPTQSAGAGGGGILATFASAAMHFLGFAGGGQVNGAGSGTSDSNFARVSDGEFIVRSAATRKNLGLLNAINNGASLPGFASGGLVGSAIRMPALSSSSSSRPTQINLHSSYDLRGASGDQSIDNKIALASHQTAVRVMDAVQRSLPGWNIQYQYEKS